MAEKTDKKPSEASKTDKKSVVYEYLPPTLDMRSDLELFQEESPKEKLIRKVTQQPLVPIGM